MLKLTDMAKVDNGLGKVPAKAATRLGIASNFRGAVQVYDGCRMLGAGVALTAMDAMPVLWLFRCTSREARRVGFPMWEGLDAACVGLGRWLGLAAAVYDRQLALREVDVSITDTPDSMDDKLVRLVTHRTIDDQVMATDLGPQTPFFII